MFYECILSKKKKKILSTKGTVDVNVVVKAEEFMAAKLQKVVLGSVHYFLRHISVKSFSEYALTIYTPAYSGTPCHLASFKSSPVAARFDNIQRMFVPLLSHDYPLREHEEMRVGRVKTYLFMQLVPR